LANKNKNNDLFKFEYISQLAQMIRQFHEAGNTQIILLGPAAVVCYERFKVLLTVTAVPVGAR
jgi:hypothetical protein